ncbi:MAG: D-arabinono-1,4-lactone oxidase, partial [Candidatus Binatia bacterium]
GHSFSALVPTDGTLVTVGRLAGMRSHDKAAKTAEFGAGTLLSQAGKPLADVGLAMPNLSDIDYQTLGGLYATSTHGTGLKFGSMSTHVTGIRLATPAGELLDIDRTSRPELFNAARVSLGALGIASRFTVQCRDAFRLKERMELRKTEEFLEEIDDLVENNQHWEMQVLTHSDYALGIWLNETDEPANSSGNEDEEGGNEFVAMIEGLHKYGSDFPAVRRALFNAIASRVTFEPRIGDCYAIFANVRNVRFNEMEYEVPREAGPKCLREILQTIHTRNLPTWFPIEYRYVAGDDIWLSQFQGRDSASISVHQFYEMDHHNFFAVIEPIFWKHGGRPHWGKVHTLNARQLRPLYPHFDEFRAVRQQLDPQGRMLNAHLRSVFGLR